LFYKHRLEYIPSKNNVIYVNPHHINVILNNEKSKKIYYKPIMSGDWDKDIRSIYGSKYRSIVQRYEKKMEWYQTELFAYYKKRLTKENNVLGCKSIDELNDYYKRNIDTLYKSVLKHGIIHDKDVFDPLYVYIGENGEFIFGDNGNHRLSIAKYLNLKSIPVKVRVRHKIWVERLQSFSSSESVKDIDKITGIKAGHPDVVNFINEYGFE